MKKNSVLDELHSKNFECNQISINLESQYQIHNKLTKNNNLYSKVNLKI